ncbi:hypothetical protein F4678DRAFT_465082 [Xylaria arbuscula]|nr:hypothetical protein F4678DRAFT_465082 [Xylaria arbuscula]
MKSKSGLTSDTTTLDAIAKDAAALSDALTASPALASTTYDAGARWRVQVHCASPLLTAYRPCSTSCVPMRPRNGAASPPHCGLCGPRNDRGFLELTWQSAEPNLDSHALHLAELHELAVCSKENALWLGVESQVRVERLRDAVLARLQILSKETQKTRDDVKEFIGSLESADPMQDCSARLGLSVDLTNYLSGVIKHLAEERSLMSLNQDFLESLYFSEVKARQLKIKSAHSKTFQWIFQSSVPDGSKAISFAQWLHEVRTRAQQIHKHLNGHCKGLLEVILDEPDAGLYFQYKVDFLHRTVRDFLLGSSKIRRILEQQRFIELGDLSNRNTSVWLLPCLSILETFKRAPFRNGPPDDADSALRLLESFMMFAREAEANMSDVSALIGMFRDAEKTYDWRRWQFSSPLDTNLFLGLVCQANLFDYIETRITPGFFTQPSGLVNSTAKFPRVEPTRTFLRYALELQMRRCLGWTLHPRIVKHLLSADASLSMRLCNDEQFREVLQMLVRHGADVKLQLPLKNGRLTTAQKLVEGILGREIEEFQPPPPKDQPDDEPIPFEPGKSL